MRSASFPAALVTPTIKLFSDSIHIGQQGSAPGDRVVFEPFVGIAPRSYQFAFEMSGKRKLRNGKLPSWIKMGAPPKVKRYVFSYLLIEEQLTLFSLPKIINPNLPEERGDAGDS